MRMENETYEEYRIRLKKEQAELKKRKKGFTAWHPSLGTATKDDIQQAINFFHEKYKTKTNN